MEFRSVVLVLVVGCLLAAGVTSAAAGTRVANSDHPGWGEPADSVAVQSAANETNESVGVGQQLATVVSVSRHDVQAGVHEESFESAFERANESERAALLAERASDIATRAASLRATHRDLRTAYENGEIGELTYAQRSAVLSARASNQLASIEQVRARARNVSASELRAAGVNRSALDTTADSLERVTGAGYRALLARFTGQRSGDVDIEAKGSTFEIAVESDDGERSREFERQRDDDPAVTVDRETALAAARDALTDGHGQWHLTRARLDRGDGAYDFEFALRGNETVGEAAVAVDGSTGEVFELEEELEPRDGDVDDEREDGEDEADEDIESDDADTEREVGHLTLAVTEGSLEPGETVTVTLRADGVPVGNVTVTSDGEPVGRTDAAGTLRLTLPREEVRLEAKYGDADAELSADFDAESDQADESETDEADETAGALAVEASYDDGTVSLTVTRDGTGVGGVAVEANGDEVGPTDEDGTVEFALTAERLELEVSDGETETERTFAVRNGTLVPVED